MAEVYVITHGEYSDMQIVGVVSSLENVMPWLLSNGHPSHTERSVGEPVLRKRVADGWDYNQRVWDVEVRFTYNDDGETGSSGADFRVLEYILDGPRVTLGNGYLSIYDA